MGQAVQPDAVLSFGVTALIQDCAAVRLTLTPKLAPDNRQAVRGRTNPLRLLRVTQADGCFSLSKVTDGEW